MLSLLGPRLDLAHDHVDAELGQHLANGGGEGTPFGLVQGDEGISHGSERPRWSPGGDALGRRGLERETSVNELHGHRSFPDGGGAALRRT
jgi:hypothetical protein